MATGKVLAMATGVLCALFMISGCAPSGPSLPDRNSAEGRALYEDCLKTLPPQDSAALKNLRNKSYFSEITKYNSLLRSCLKLKETAFTP